mmetsp:Transcript_24951/g.39182  ORF Transcript_24951/g.39182 Transcript_24951/m.39182 type:complete len:136 (-) Transcript_24951:87-494(-)
MATTKRRYPDGMAIESVQIAENSSDSLGLGDAATRSSESIDNLFITMCFYARLGFVQPPSCLKCAHRKAVKKTDDGASCNGLVPWRRDANMPLHPDGLGDNLVFVTCETAKRLIGGDAYPSIQWDSKNRRILHET